MSDAPLIDARGIVRHFGHVQALQGADFSVGRGEIVALIGDNGAGKSTLIRILSGTDRPDDGEIRVNGQLVHFKGPQDARAAGIETVYQDLALAPDLDAAANVFLGRELMRPGLLGRLGVLDKSRMVRQTGEAMAQTGCNDPPVSRSVHPLRGPAAERGSGPRCDVGHERHFHGRAHRQPWGYADQGCAGSDPAGARCRHRDRRHQPQPAPDLGDCGPNCHSAPGPDGRTGRSCGRLCRRSRQSDDVRHPPERDRMSKPGESSGEFTTTSGASPNEQDVDSTLGRLRSIFGSQSAALFLVLVTLAVFFSVLTPRCLSHGRQHHEHGHQCLHLAGPGGW